MQYRQAGFFYFRALHLHHHWHRQSDLDTDKKRPKTSESGQNIVPKLIIIWGQYLKVKYSYVPQHDLKAVRNYLVNVHMRHYFQILHLLINCMLHQHTAQKPDLLVPTSIYIWHVHNIILIVLCVTCTCKCFFLVHTFELLFEHLTKGPSFCIHRP